MKCEYMDLPSQSGSTFGCQSDAEFALQWGGAEKSTHTCRAHAPIFVRWTFDLDKDALKEGMDVPDQYRLTITRIPMAT